jgi:hypothetical protein
MKIFIALFGVIVSICALVFYLYYGDAKSGIALLDKDKVNNVKVGHDNAYAYSNCVCPSYQNMSSFGAFDTNEHFIEHLDKVPLPYLTPLINANSDSSNNFAEAMKNIKAGKLSNGDKAKYQATLNAISTTQQKAAISAAPAKK